MDDTAKTAHALLISQGFLLLWVSPAASRTSLAGLATRPDGHTYLKLKTTAEPAQGKANAAIIQYLAGLWGLPVSQLAISTGTTSRFKRLTWAQSRS